MGAVSIYSEGYQNPTTRKFASIEEIERIVTTETWSPVVYRENLRKAAGFHRSWFVVLDFDGGKTIDEIKGWLIDAAICGLIGPTRHHQLEKGTQVACDRFRLILPLKNASISGKLYQAVTRWLAEHLGADLAATDNGRLYYPCRSVEYVSHYGKYPLERFDLEGFAKEHEIDFGKKGKFPKRGLPKSVLYWQELGIPPQVCMDLAHAPEGTRHHLLLRATCLAAIRPDWKEGDFVEWCRQNVGWFEGNKKDLETIRDGWRWSMENIVPSIKYGEVALKENDLDDEKLASMVHGNI